MNYSLLMDNLYNLAKSFKYLPKFIIICNDVVLHLFRSLGITLIHRLLREFSISLI